MDHQDKTREELIKELQALEQEHNSLKASHNIDITECKQMEEEMRATKELYRSILNASPDEIAISDIEGHILLASSFGLKMFGLDSNDLLQGRLITDFVVPGDRKRAESNIALLLQGTLSGPVEYLGLRKDGSVFNIEVNAEFIRDAMSQPLQLVIIVRDITERKQAEHKLKESKNYLDKIINSIASPIFVKDDKHKFCLVNNAFCSLLKLPVEKVIGTTDYDYFPEEQVKVFIEKDEEVFKTGKESINEEFLTDGTGKIRTIVTRKTLYTDTAGNKFLVGVINDITERKKAEEALQESEANLAEAQQIAHIGSWEWDMISDIMKLSNEMYRVLDLNPDSFDEKSESLIKVFHPDDVKSFIDGMKANISGSNLPSLEYRVIHRDGSTHTLSAKSRVEFNEAGRPVKSIGTAQDITVMSEQEYKSSLEQMHQLTQYLEKVREAERVAISRELHDDLGQALTAVKIDLGMIKKHVPDNEVVFKINKLSTLVSETIKTVQRITSQLRPEMLDDLGLEAAIEWYTKEYAERNGVEVIADMDSGITYSPNVSLHIFRIIQEALTNIARHSRATMVHIRLGKTGDFINLRISDNGIGINENKIKSKSSFGIISMKERAISIGGALEVYNENGSGTVIKLNIPLNNK